MAFDSKFDSHQFYKLAAYISSAPGQFYSEPSSRLKNDVLDLALIFNNSVNHKPEMDSAKESNEKSGKARRGPKRTSDLTVATNISGLTFPSSAMNEK